LKFFRHDPNDILPRLVTKNETWLYHYGPEIKLQSLERRHSGLPRPKLYPSAKIGWKILASIFFGDEDRILLIDYLPKGQNNNAEYYSSLVVQLKAILKEKRRGKFIKGFCSCTTMPRLTGHLQPRRNWPA